MAFYFLFDTAEDAENALPSFQSDVSVQLKKQAAEARQSAEDSFQRCDTDGFVSQYCSNITAVDKESEASLANNANLSIFPVLVDTLTGSLVATTIFTFPSRFHYGTDNVWCVKRSNNAKPEWIGLAKKESTYSKKNLKKVWMIAPAKLYGRQPGDKTPEKRGLSGLASYRGKSIGIDYNAAGLSI